MTDSDGPAEHENRMSRRKFIIWAYSFDDTSGGKIALHLLCRRLIEAGEEAYIWKGGKPALRGRFGLFDVLRAIRYELGRTKWRYRMGPFNNPVARRRDLEGAIVVYPEVVAGNPLSADHVVRWLLHRPGYHNGESVYGEGDLFFHYQDAFTEGAPGTSRRLTLTWVNETYRDLGFNHRSGSTYLMRKGEGRELVHDLADSVPVDELSHEERLLAFNKAKFAFSYDLYTYYSVYAAICGCVPVIVPQPGVTKEQWLPDAKDRYGLAYGLDNVEWAVGTRDKLLERLQDGRREEDAKLRDFVAACRVFWG